MSFESDVIVDRRRMRRKLTFWRVVAAVVAIVAIAGLAVVATPGGRSAITGSGEIARIKIDGLIRSDQARVEALERLEKSSASAVIVHINSPGGTTAGSEQLYDAITRLRAKKPVVVVVEGLAASGGYIAALAADRIIAQQSSLVGSIGVLIQYPDVSGLMDRLRAARPVDPVQPVLVAGDPERAQAEVRGREGAPLPRGVRRRLRDVAAAAGAPFLLKP